MEHRFRLVKNPEPRPENLRQTMNHLDAEGDIFSDSSAQYSLTPQIDSPDSDETDEPDSDEDFNDYKSDIDVDSSDTDE